MEDNQSEDDDEFELNPDYMDSDTELEMNDQPELICLNSNS